MACILFGNPHFHISRLFSKMIAMVTKWRKQDIMLPEKIKKYS